MQSPYTYSKSKRDNPLTCGNCMHVCHPDPEERKRRLELLRQGGVIIQHKDGSLQAVSPEEHRTWLQVLFDWNQPNLESSERALLLEIAIRLRTDCVSSSGVVCMCGCVFVPRVPTGIMFF